MALNLLPFPFLLIPGSGCTWMGSRLPVWKPKPSCMGSTQATCKQQPTTRRAAHWGMVCPRRVDPEKKPTPILKMGLGQLGREFWSSDYLEHVLEEGWGLNGHIPLVSRTPCYSSRRSRAEPQAGTPLPEPKNTATEWALRRATRIVLLEIPLKSLASS